MCKVCGCSDGEARVEGRSLHAHEHDGGHDQHDHAHHEDGHHHDHGYADATARGDLHFGRGPAGASVAGVSETRLLRIEEDILSKNRAYAEQNRRRLAEQGILAINLVSSPGAGKTTLLVATIERLKAELPVAVIEGDQETARDADRIRATGVPAVQINTGRGCHLDAHMVGHALDELPLRPRGILFVENVGNLVCPAGFDLGEAHKVAILSVTEGDDKPLKYPDAFAAADLMVVAKIDLLPHVDFDVGAAIERARRVNPAIEVVRLSARTGEGMDEWIDWLRGRRAGLRPASAESVHA